MNTPKNKDDFLSKAPLSERIGEKRLRHLYFERDLSTVQIADLLKTNRESVRRLIHKYGLKMRTTGAGKRRR